MSTTTSLLARVRTALAGDEDLARQIIKELSDKDDLLERIEDAVAEKMEMAQRLEAALATSGDSTALTARLQKLESDYRQAVEAKNRFADELQRLKSSLPTSGAPSVPVGAVSDEVLRELEQLRQTRSELEQELMMRDEVLAQLRTDMQQGGRPTGDGAYDTLLEEKNNMAEQLTLALSQLEEVTDREGLVAKLDQKTRQASDLDEQLQQTLTENGALRARLSEAEDKAKRFERASQGPGDEQHRHSPVTIWVVGIVLFLAIYLGANRRSAPIATPEPSRSPIAAAAADRVKTEILEDVARHRLFKQRGALPEVVDAVAKDRSLDAGHLREAVEAAVDDDEPYRKALAAVAAGRFDDALVELQAEDERRISAQGMLLYLRGRTAFFAGRLADANRLLRQAVERDYTLTDAWRALGDLYVFDERTEDALRCYREALKVDPKDARALAAIGGIYSLNDDLDKAIASYQQAVEIDRSLVEALYALGMVYQRKEDWGRAAQYFEEVILLDPSNARAHWDLARCYDVLGKGDKARQHRSRAEALGFEDLGPNGPTEKTTAATGGGS